MKILLDANSGDIHPITNYKLQITNNIAQEAGKKILPYQGYYKKLAFASLFKYSYFELTGHIVKSVTFSFLHLIIINQLTTLKHTL